MAYALDHRDEPMLREGLSAQAVRVIVADPDKLCRQRIKALLKAEHDLEVVHECGRASEIMAAMAVHKPDLLLLEPQLPGGNIFELMDARPPESLPLIIFATTHDQYALKALETKAVDFLLKPFSADRFRTAIERARLDLAARREAKLTRRQHDVIRMKAVSPERLVVKLRGRVVFLGAGEVDWIEAAANYVEIHAGNEVYRTREPIGRIEKRVIVYGLARIHRSAIVNLAKIKEVSCCNSGEYMVRLKSGKELPCSRNYNSVIRIFLERAGA